MSSRIFGVLAVLLAAAAVVLTVSFLNAQPVLVEAPAEAGNCVEELMDAACAGDYEKVSACLVGKPDLGLSAQPEGETGRQIWQAYQESLSWQLEGECYATDSGLAQKVILTGMEIPSVTANLGQRAQKLLTQRVEEARDLSQIYDENNEYREDFVMEVLSEAVADAIREDAVVSSQELVLNLVYSQGQWRVQPEQKLLSALSGGIAG